ncbi:hypothetical protein L1285_20950 [Pseudoalteromonas sp. DL2-H2.2]|uniref:hypothetical protein n=1 Tax=Pseudoalteromonas sp. DL2-H2.2 TaxID=2908889 RepID=UPI001F335688|nr:hypothetical protein [Pseudoalteromonas sp. DL2-H2.2]MCF2910780.1 hypothetical protein [Pseudoalteromonas sp. DL2-H2.2]
MKKFKHKNDGSRVLSQGIAKVVAAGNGSGNDPITQARAAYIDDYLNAPKVKISNP